MRVSIFLIGNSLTHERFLPYLMIHLLDNAAFIAGLLIGGLAQSNREVQAISLELNTGLRRTTPPAK